MLIASDATGRIVEERTIAVEQYYDGGIDLIDSDDYRARSGISALKGTIYGPRGRIDQEFDNRYARNGKLEWSRAVHADGQVIENDFRGKP